MPLLEVHQLTRRFGERFAVSGLTFEVNRTEAVGLLGVNGAGKTTTLRLLAGYLAPHGGTARLDGFDLLREPREVRRRVGYLAEGSPLPPEMRVERYLRFRAGLKGLGRAAAISAVSRVVDRCDLGAEHRTVISHLSRGFRQRVGLADALLGDPPLLLLDEPTSGLDPAQVRELRGLLREVAAERTVLLSSHVLSEVEALCDRVLVLNRGTLIADGPPRGLVPNDQTRHLLLVVRGAANRVTAALTPMGGLGPIGIRETEPGLCLVRAEILSGDPRADAARAVANADLDLLELRVEVPSFEDAFVGLLGAVRP